MTANITWAPVSERQDLQTWRPSSFIEKLCERFGSRQFYPLGAEDIEWLKQVESEMGRDGNGHSEAEQLIRALAVHGEVIVEIDG